MPNRLESIIIVVGIVLAGALFIVQFPAHLYVAGSLIALTTSYGLGLRQGVLANGWLYGSASSFAVLSLASGVLSSIPHVNAAGIGASVVATAQYAHNRFSTKSVWMFSGVLLTVSLLIWLLSTRP